MRHICFCSGAPSPLAFAFTLPLSYRGFFKIKNLSHRVDANEHVGQEEERLVQNLKSVKVPVVLGLNKIDLKGRCIPEYISLWERLKGLLGG